MPELPDVEAYLAALRPKLLEQPLERVRVVSPFLLRSVTPPLEAAHGRRVLELRRLGKRLAFGLEGDLWLVLHLMIAGRLFWRKPGAKPPGKRGLAAFDLPQGTLLLTEAGSKRRASLHVVQGEAGLAEHDRGGREPLALDLAGFQAQLALGNHTLKRALTDPRFFAGIGNAYSDEILHRARLSPVTLTSRLDAAQTERLFAATQAVLREWTARLCAEALEAWPEKVTAFRPDMAVHGKFGEPCPVCASPVQRIRYADRETNYCAPCQTEGKLLKDRGLSRLLKQDWPRTLD
ncbi:MAG: formamidopyrimidine-DNA glycosylase [Planctomycetes bacterium]|nr:formamidopyrimidine-DNA glycosylase [Planctomycetota bacterium]